MAGASDPDGGERLSAAFQMEDPLSELRLCLFANGYAPIPVTDFDYKHSKVGSPGKQPFFRGWQNLTRDTITRETILSWSTSIAKHTNTGLLTGTLIGVDIDITAPGLAAEVDKLAEAMLGATLLHRVGKAPKVVRCYRVDTPIRKMETPELFLPEHVKAQVEILGAGQQFVGYGIHPGTKQPYQWLFGTPETTPLASLPVLTETMLQTFLTAAEGALRRAGGRTEKELKAAARIDTPADPPTNVGPRDESFFSRTNAAALQALPLWFPVLFPRAREEPGTGAWRVSSEDLGRSLEEDISVHPTAGGRDFGTGDSCSAIDLVLEWGRVSDPMEAALRICNLLGKDPVALGWKPPRPHKSNRSKNDKSDGNPEDDARPVIQLSGGKLDQLATKIEAAIKASTIPVFQRGSALVRPITFEVPASRGRMTNTAGLAELTQPAMLDIYSQVARWQRYDKRSKDWHSADPPGLVAAVQLSRAGQWTLPPVAGVITTLTLRPDGSVLIEPGYDPTTRLYHLPDPTLAMPALLERPSYRDALDAMEILDDLLVGFPFVSPVARAVALSALITPVVRGSISVAPAHVIKASTAGTGKSYLLDVASAIATGRPCPVIAAAPSADETDKRLVGLLLAAFPIVSIDNCNGELGSDILCQAVERPLIRVRKLGGSDITEIESRACIFATGNALRVRGDMVRRTLVCSLDAGVERPELRKFTSDPVETVLADRGRYVAACLTIVRAYAAAGFPERLTSLASFSDWSSTVRSALVWLGQEDPCRSMEDARDDDPELTQLREMLSLWRQHFGADHVTARDVAERSGERLKASMGAEQGLAAPELREALLRVAGERGNINTRRLGQWLLNSEGRIVDSLRVVRRGTAHGGVTKWAVDDLRACA